jgi:hypothetical protein
MNKHTRPCHCTSPGCTQSFARRADRTRHENSVHNQEVRSSGQVPPNQSLPNQQALYHFCPVPTCERSRQGFARKDHLKQHSKVHAKRSTDEDVEQIGESASATVAQTGELSSPAVSEPVLCPRKRQRRSEASGGGGQDSSESETEVERLKRKVDELTDDKKRLQDQVEKQTDIIYSLTRAPRNS